MKIKKVGFLVDELGGWWGVNLPFGCPIVNFWPFSRGQALTRFYHCVCEGPEGH